MVHTTGIHNSATNIKPQNAPLMCADCVLTSTFMVHQSVLYIGSDCDILDSSSKSLSISEASLQSTRAYADQSSCSVEDLQADLLQVMAYVALGVVEEVEQRLLVEGDLAVAREHQSLTPGMATVRCSVGPWKPP